MTAARTLTPADLDALRVVVREELRAARRRVRADEPVAVVVDEVAQQAADAALRRLGKLPATKRPRRGAR